MLAAHQSCIRTITVPHHRSFSDQTPPIAYCSFDHSSIRLDLKFLKTKRRRPPKSILISCNSSGGNSDSRSSSEDDPESDSLKASLLVSETISHYRMLMRKRFQETKWQSAEKSRPSIPKGNLKSEIPTIGLTILRSFQSPTIFLKISCDGDFLFPILVEEHVILRLMESSWGEEYAGESPQLYQFARNLVEKLGYEVKWMTITERVKNTYYAKLYFGKPGESQILSVDARPSDAINVAYKCEAPIYVNKQVVLADAVRFGMGRGHDGKPSYDVSLDSAVEGRDSLSEELGVAINMELAIKEERYDDAAMWREKLIKLRKLEDDH